MRSGLFALLSLASAMLLAQGEPPKTTPPTLEQQVASASQTSGAQKGDEKDAPPLKAEELEQIVAPIALYPDALLAQVFMASTYPLEIVYAARWQKQHPDVKGDAVSKAVEKEDWDPAVKSLVAFPDVLTMMNDKLDWTQKLGDAFLAQRKETMDAVQRLRVRAKNAGHLESGKEQTVRTEMAPAPEGGSPTGAATTQVIVIEQADPQVVYVPTYNPTVVYGAWPYPAYPPYYYYPPGYAAGAAFFSFSVGMMVGGAMWGGCNWGYGDVDINVNRYNNFNRNTNINRNINDRGWRHDSSHRRGVGYRDSASQQRYGNWGSEQGVRSRDEFRGRAEAGRDQIAREGVGDRGGLGNERGIGDQGGLGGGDRGIGDQGGVGGDRGISDGAGNRDFGNTAGNRDFGGGGGQNRDFGGGQQSTRDVGGGGFDPSSASSRSRSPGAFEGVGNGSGTRMSSSRGAASRGGGFSRGGGGGRRR